MSGAEPRFTGKFWMQCPMFLQVAASGKPPPPPHLHPWVIAADTASYSYRANPRPPVVYGRRNGLPVPIEECEPKHLRPGDVIAFTFTVAYILTEKEWYPQYQPVEIYVLKQAARSDMDDYDTSERKRTPPPTMGSSVVEGTSSTDSMGPVRCYVMLTSIHEQDSSGRALSMTASEEVRGTSSSCMVEQDVANAGV